MKRRRRHRLAALFLRVHMGGAQSSPSTAACRLRGACCKQGCRTPGELSPAEQTQPGRPGDDCRVGAGGAWVLRGPMPRVGTKEGAHRPDVGPVIGRPGQDVGAVAGEAGADVEGAAGVARVGRQGPQLGAPGVVHVVAAAAAGHQQARACAGRRHPPVTRTPVRSPACLASRFHAPGWHEGVGPRRRLLLACADRCWNRGQRWAGWAEVGHQPGTLRVEGEACDAVLALAQILRRRPDQALRRGLRGGVRVTPPAAASAAVCCLPHDAAAHCCMQVHAWKRAFDRNTPAAAGHVSSIETARTAISRTSTPAGAPARWLQAPAPCVCPRT